MQEISIITPYNLKIPYSYLASKELKLQVGDIVTVPLRNKKTYGVVVANTSNSYHKELKHVIDKVAHIKLLPTMVSFVQWSAGYNIINLGALLNMVLSLPEAVTYNITQQEEEYFSYNQTTKLSDQIKLTSKIQQALNIFQAKNKVSAYCIKELKIEKNTLKKLLQHNLISSSKELLPIVNTKQRDINSQLAITLNLEQQQVLDNLVTAVKQNKFSVSLLDGVPGSGKTEVYFKLIAEVIKNNKAALVLLPEIALSTQWLSRFKETFNCEPYVWHSNISKKEKKATFTAILTGEVKVIVGTRSALFLPFNNLGIIIVDEEHDSSFKQEEKVVYNARDMAIIRAKFENISIVLATATPSLESWHNAKIGKYNYFQLKTRFNQNALPKIRLIDMNLTTLNKGECISEPLLQALITNFNNKQQSLLFINKRGYSTLSLCKNCGNRTICPKCSHNEENQIYLVEHKHKNQLICHHCGFWQKVSTDCNVCGAKNSIVSFGFAIEKVAEEVQNKLPQARIALASSDIITNSAKAEELVANITQQKVDIIIGTQILAKGYHFPNLSLVGIVDAGLENSSMDLKSNERIWQLLYQVAGRAGREKTKGDVVIQSYNNNFLIKTLVNLQRDQFLEYELKNRKDNNMPPFTRLASVIVSSVYEKSLQSYVQQLKKATLSLHQEEQDCIKGPVPALFYKLNQRFRYRFLINGKKNYNIQKLIINWLNRVKTPSNIFIKIDIDPISFY